VFENQAGETWVKNDKGEKIKLDIKQLVKEIYGIELKPEKLNKFQKEKLAKEKKEKVVKEKVVKPIKQKITNEKAVKPTKEKPSVESKYKEGDSVTFTPRLKKHRTSQEPITGIIARIFIGVDGKLYAKIKVGEKSYLKQVKSL